MASSLRIWKDSPIAIWNDLQTEKTFHPLSSIYPALGVIAIFLFVHFLMDRLFLGKASNYARSVTNTKPPKWIKSSEYAKQLTFEKISAIPYKKFAKSMKKFDLDSSKQHELISYQKQCNEFAKHVSKYQNAFNGLAPQSAGTHPIFNLNIYYFLQIGTHGHR